MRETTSVRPSGAAVSNGWLRTLKGLVGSGDRIALFVLPFLIGGVVLNYLYPSLFAAPPLSPAARALVWIALGAGVVAWLWSVALILSKVPKGELITDGPFALVKHPLYTAVSLLVLPAAGLLLGSWLGVLIGAPLYVAARLYAPAEAFRIISADEIAPLSPGAEKKRVVVDLSEQALSAFEGKAEVFRAKISSGALFFGEDGKTLTSGTPGGDHIIWQKRVARHMQGGTRESGYDLPGVGWVAYFASNGAALHSTFWHNDFGTPKSHGCLNCRPEDAKWLFRWTAPAVPYEPGNITVNMSSPGTVLNIRVEA